MANIKDIEPELSDIGADANTLFLAQFGISPDDSLVGQINARANAYAAQRAGDLVTMIDESTRDMLRDDIAAGLADNLSYSDIADKLQDSYAFSDDRAELIATTEIRIANGNGNLEAMRQGIDAGLNLMKYWQADADPCPECVENEDAGPIPIDEDFPSGDAVDPAHPNAVLAGSTFMPYGGLQRMVAAEYDGLAITLNAGGYCTTIGPNHPMLTDRGMVKAKFLNVGDKLVYDSRAINHFELGGSDFDKMKLVQNSFAALKSAFGYSNVTAARDDLHGDIIYCKDEIQVVFPKGELLDKLDTLGLESFREDGLVRPDVQLVHEAGLRPGIHAFDRIYLPSAGYMGGGLTGHYKLLTLDMVEETHFKGWAFDCTTPSSLYCSDGFVVSNCECTVLSVEIRDDGTENETDDQ